MTKAQIWTAAFLGLFIILFVLQKLTKEPESGHPNGMPMTQQESSSNTQYEGASGKDLLVTFGCTTCHGADVNGTNLAPGLAGLKKHYDRDKLINYLRNPQSFMDDSRFTEFKLKYKNIAMPSFNNKDVKELGKIADYLLSIE